MNRLLEKLGKSEVRTVLALITLIGCLSLVGVMQLFPIPPENKDVLNIAMGFLFGSCLAPVFQFFFGSSKTEADKTDTDKKDK